jgi:hypothetical protein
MATTVGVMNTIRRLTTVTVIGVLFVPVIRDHDSFPLSTYPMYAFERPDVVALSTAVGIDDEGDRHRLDLDLIGESDDPLIVASLVRRAIRDGQSTSMRLCTDVADRTAERELGYTTIEVVTERHDVVARATDKPSLVSSTLHASCTVEPPR